MARIRSRFVKPDPKLYSPKLKESEFKKYLYLFIQGDPVAGRRWLNEVAKRPSTQVQVIDDKTEEFLFWVPPIFRGGNTKLGGPFNYMATEHQAMIKKQVSPQIIDRFMDHAIPSELFETESEPEAADKAWAEIAKRYGYVPKDPVRKFANEPSGEIDESDNWGD